MLRISLSSGCRAGQVLLFIATTLGFGWQANAQRADLNAVTAAEDAFGTTTGHQSIGLYSLNDARGFNPQQAGNLRLEGLYYNQTSPYLNQCLVRDTSIRVGIAAQSVSFPAPSGVADLHLHAPDGETRSSLVANFGSFGEKGALIEGQSALGHDLSVLGCVAYERNFFNDEARKSQNLTAGSVMRWRPSSTTEVTPFISVSAGNDSHVVPQVYSDGYQPPPVYVPQELATGDYSKQNWHFATAGLIVRQAINDRWMLSLGAFESHEQDGLTYIEEYLSVLPDRSASHTVDIVPALTSNVLSGELRLARRTVDGDHSRKIELSLRGRNSRREYGGDALINLGPVTLNSPAARDIGPYSTSPTSEDTTQQWDTAISYEERFAGRGSLALGLLQSHYQRTIQDPGTLPVSDRTTPILGSARLTLNAGPQVTLYSSFLQGLEDAQLAPTIASNRGQPPPATRTHQVDGGLRYAPDQNLTFILGGFAIDKAYFNLNDATRYTQLGTIKHQGLESSTTWSHSGYTAVAGAVWLRPSVMREIPEAGATGTVPLGPTPLTLTLNLDLAPPTWSPWAAELQVNRHSGGVATTDNRWHLDPVTTLNAGLRYEVKWHERAISVRLDLQNATNSRGLRLSSVGQLLPEQERRFGLYLAIDN